MVNIGTQKTIQKKGVTMTDMPAKKYDSVAKWLHWLIAIIVLLMLLGGWGLGDLEGEELVQTIKIHSGLGTLVLILMLIRWAWRLTRNPPEPEPMKNWQLVLSKATHWAFYGLLVLQPVFGILQAAFIDYSVKAFGLIDYSSLAVDNKEFYGLFHELHEINAMLLILLAAIHIVAAIYHHFFVKDNVLRRMIPFGKVE